MTHTLHIPDFHPAKLNTLLSGHWGKGARLKRADREIIAAYAHQSEIPKATGKRKVSLLLVLEKGQRAADPDASWKSLLDALQACQLIRNDNRQGVELGPVEFARGERRRTFVMLEDVE